MRCGLTVTTSSDIPKKFHVHRKRTLGSDVVDGAHAHEDSPLPVLFRSARPIAVDIVAKIEGPFWGTHHR